MLLYLTYKDQPSGVYWSQVTDVVEHLNRPADQAGAMGGSLPGPLSSLRHEQDREQAYWPESGGSLLHPQAAQAQITRGAEIRRSCAGYGRLGLGRSEAHAR